MYLHDHYMHVIACNDHVIACNLLACNGHVMLVIVCNDLYITCHYMHYIKLHTHGGFSTSFAGLCYPLTALFHAANMLNTHEDL